MLKLKEIDRRKLFWTDLITSIYFEILLVQIKGQYSKLELTMAQNNIFRDKWSLNDPQVRLTKHIGCALSICLVFLTFWYELRYLVLNQKVCP